ncbi:MAG: hypothetical protein Q8O88_05970 [bacterium]|nr:hypothetical protein [bacterium]
MSEDKIMKKLEEHDERFEKIDERFEKIDERFEKIDVRFEKIENTLASHDIQLETIVRTVLKHDEDIGWIKENMATKDDIRNIADNMDVLVGLAKKKDQELTFMGERVKRVEYDVEKIKPLVGLV